MIKKISVYDFINEFKNCGRSEQFTREGLMALFEYLEDYEDATGELMELDVIALCCEFTQYESIEDFKNDYDYDIEDIEDIEDYTSVININDTSFIIQDF